MLAPGTVLVTRFALARAALLRAGGRHGAAWMVLLAGLAAACSPALNWRSVALGEWSVVLPCKPDHGQRTVLLAGQALTMEMVGCEADGTLFAISRVRVPGALAPALLREQWQAASLQQMQALPNPQSAPEMAGSKAHPMPVLSAQGRASDGQPTQARLAWVTVGADMVHFAAYGPRLTSASTAPFFDGIRAP